MPPVPDALAILTTLVEHGCRFVVIGGMAVAYHGYVRATKDLDIVPDPEPENLRRLWAALAALGARPLALGDLRPDELPLPFDIDGLLELGNWDLATRHGRLDLLQFIAGKLEVPEDYADLARRAEETALTLGTVLFVSYEDLIDLKNLAGRDQDLIDIRALREARGDHSPE